MTIEELIEQTLDEILEVTDFKPWLISVIDRAIDTQRSTQKCTLFWAKLVVAE